MHPTGGPNPAGSPASRWLPVRCAGEPPPVLRQRSRLVRGLVRRAHACPTRGWEAIADGDHTLILAPTGSGKTLAAFLWAIDRLASEPPPDPKERTRVLYVSPLRALAVDVEKNLRAPLAGIQHAAERRASPSPTCPRSASAPATPRPASGGGW